MSFIAAFRVKRESALIFVDLAGVSPDTMPHLCHICRVHRSDFRRRCILCRRLVGPGCLPECCLARDFGVDRGFGAGVCKECMAAAECTRLLLTCLELHPGLDIVVNSGYFPYVGQGRSASQCGLCNGVTIIEVFCVPVFRPLVRIKTM